MKKSASLLFVSCAFLAAQKIHSMCFVRHSHAAVQPIEGALFDECAVIEMNKSNFLSVKDCDKNMIESIEKNLRNLDGSSFALQADDVLVECSVSNSNSCQWHMWHPLFRFTFPRFLPLSLFKDAHVGSSVAFLFAHQTSKGTSETCKVLLVCQDSSALENASDAGLHDLATYVTVVSPKNDTGVCMTSFTQPEDIFAE